MKNMWTFEQILWTCGSCGSKEREKQKAVTAWPGTTKWPNVSNGLTDPGWKQGICHCATWIGPVIMTNGWPVRPRMMRETQCDVTARPEKARFEWWMNGLSGRGWWVKRGESQNEWEWCTASMSLHYHDNLCEVACETQAIYENREYVAARPG